MALEHAEFDIRLRGGSDVWDQPQASVVLLDDFFEAAPPAGTDGLILVSGVLQQSAAPAGGDLKVYLNAGLLYGKTAAGGGDVLVRSTAGALTTT